MILNGQVSSYAIREVEEYKNFCDRPRDQRPLPEEVISVSPLVMFHFQVVECLSHMFGHWTLKTWYEFPAQFGLGYGLSQLMS